MLCTYCPFREYEYRAMRTFWSAIQTICLQQNRSQSLNSRCDKLGKYTNSFSICICCADFGSLDFGLWIGAQRAQKLIHSLSFRSFRGFRSSRSQWIYIYNIYENKQNRKCFVFIKRINTDGSVFGYIHLYYYTLGLFLDN